MIIQSSNSIRKRPKFSIFHGFFPHFCQECGFKLLFLRKIDVYFLALSFGKGI